MKTGQLIAAIAFAASGLAIPFQASAQSEPPEDNSHCNGVWCTVLICDDGVCREYHYPDPAGDPPPDDNP